MASFVTYDFAQSYLGLPASTNPGQFQAFLDTAAQVACDWCDRRFLSQTYTNEIYCGNNTSNLILKQYPVTNVASLYLDNGAYFGSASGAFGPTALLVAGTDYALTLDGCLGSANEGSTDQTPASLTGIVKRISSVWPGRLTYVPGQLVNQISVGAGNIQVTYTAGWTVATMPMTLRAAICNLAKVIQRSAPFGGQLGSESWQGYSYSLLNGSVGRYPELGTTRDMLGKYRRRT